MGRSEGSSDRRWRLGATWIVAGTAGLCLTTLGIVVGMSAVADEDWSANLLANGSFEDTAGMRPKSFGFTGEMPAWTSEAPHPVELVSDGTLDMPAADGTLWLDMGQAGAKVIDVSQRVENLDPGERLRLVVHAGQWQTPSEPPDESLNIFWGGELLATVRPETEGSYERFEVELVAGAGDGTDSIRFQGVGDGTADNQGVALDQVGLFRVDP